MLHHSQQLTPATSSPHTLIYDNQFRDEKENKEINAEEKEPGEITEEQPPAMHTLSYKAIIFQPFIPSPNKQNSLEIAQKEPSEKVQRANKKKREISYIMDFW